jgi:hypothetical protein
MVEMGDCMHHTNPAGPVFDGDSAGVATELRRSDPGAGDGLGHQSRADVLGLSDVGPAASLARPVSGELSY